MKELLSAPISAWRLSYRVAALYLFTNGFSTVRSQDFIATGRVEFESISRGQASREISFSCSVRGCKWLIRAQASDEREYTEFSSDGVNSYEFGKIPKRAGEAGNNLGKLDRLIASLPDGPKKNGLLKAREIARQELEHKKALENDKHVQPENKATGRIYSGNVMPRLEAHFIQWVWLAFCSDCYLATATSNAMIRSAWFEPGVAAIDLPEARAEWELSKATPNLPLTLRIFDRRLSESVPRLEYRVLEATNVSGVGEFPKRFEFIQKLLRPSKLNRDVSEEQVNRLIGTVDTVQSFHRENESFAPEVKVKTLVQDGRFREELPTIKHIPYLLEPGKWLTKSEVRNSKAFENFARIAGELERIKREGHRNLWYVWVGFAFLLLIPVTLHLVRKQKNIQN